MKLFNSILLAFYLFATSIIVVGQEKVSSEKLKKDAEIAFRALNELHPGLYRQTDTLTINASYQKLLTTFEEDQTELEAFKQFSEFIAAIKCGHTYTNPYNQKKALSGQFLENKTALPFLFEIIEDKMVVTNSVDSKVTKGDIITHLNGFPTSKIFKSIIKSIKGDGGRDNKRIYDLQLTGESKYEFFDIYYPLYYELGESVEIQTLKGEKKSIALVSVNDRVAKFKEMGLAAAENYDALWEFNIDADKSLGYLKLGTFVVWKMKLDWKKFIDDAFAELAAKGVKNLIIDIRGNEGGDSDVRPYLLSKIISEAAYSSPEIPHLAYQKVPEDLKPYLSTWKKNLYNTSAWTKKLDDNYRTIKLSSGKGKKIKPSANNFKGNVAVLCNAANSSSTFHLSQFVKNNKLGTLIGDETGGSLRGINGDFMFFLTLPGSKVEIDIPLIGQYPPTEMKDEGIQPDIVVEKTIADFLIGKDTQLEAAKDYLSAK